MNNNSRETILVVDDVPENIDRLVNTLMSTYRVTCATNGVDALSVAQAQPHPNLIMLDVMMPGMDGLEVCHRLKADLRTRDIPIIFLTAMSDNNDEELGLKMGAVDYLQKSCHPALIQLRVKIHLERHNQNVALEDKIRKRTHELEQTRLEIVRRLSRAGEYRDNETGMHVVRMSLYCQLLALAAGIPAVRAETLQQAAPMHDIGKIGIPDHILLKPGKLDADEWLIMKRHPLIGAEIIGQHSSKLLTMAHIVALTHHEKWDGSGYPCGLKDEETPIEGRITAICDVYDALTSERPYKKAWTSQEAVDFIRNESGKHFDPQLVRLFIEQLPAIERIRACYADTPSRDG